MSTTIRLLPQYMMKNQQRVYVCAFYVHQIVSLGSYGGPPTLTLNGRADLSIKYYGWIKIIDLNGSVTAVFLLYNL